MTFIPLREEKTTAEAPAVHDSSKSFRNSQRGGTMKILATFAMLVLLGIASSASALILTGGPVYTLPSGGTCSLSTLPTTKSPGVTVTCSGVNLSAHTHVYFGIRNDINTNGNTMTGSAPAASGSEIFAFTSNTSSSITYGSTTTVADQIHGSQTVTNRLVLTLTSGTGTVVSTAGSPTSNPPSNSKGAIERLFEITGGTSFQVRVDVQASDPLHSLGYALDAVYEPTNTPASGASDFSKVDLAFYYSDCGDGVVDSPEQCDQGSLVNGTASSCCTATCTLRGSGQVCRPGAGAPCDVSETCTGSSPLCPPDDAPINSGNVCRTGSGDICDQNEVCDGIPGHGCPADDAPGNTSVICRLSSAGDVCDESEYCSGVPGATCPPDDAPSHINMVCRPGSGDICDPDEKCTGIPGQGCPPDTVANPSTVCRTGSGDICDPDEHCTAVPGQPCPADSVASAGTECRAAAGTCDVAEQCTGVAGQTCPPNAFKAATTPCNEDANVCTVDECDGNGNCTFNSNLNCDDGVACTQDSCDPINGCQYSGTPSNSCISASKALFSYKNSDTDTKDGVKFLWKGGPSLIADMGDPTQSTSYELCVYDASGVQLAIDVPPGAGWDTLGAPSSPKGYKYKDTAAATDGVKLIKTKASTIDKAQVKLIGKGDALPDTAVLPFQFPVIAQMYASDGACWEAQFDQAETKKNDGGRFLGKVTQ
jgi:hypothetical protein